MVREQTTGQPGEVSDAVCRIIHAATEVFADVGFAGARMDMIAKKAGVNKATIYYHIGNKDALYATVLHEVLGGGANVILERTGKTDDPVEKLEDYLQSIVSIVNDNPHMLAIMMREMSTGGKNMPEIAVKDISLMFARLTDILEEGAEKGVFIDTFPPFLHFMAVGSVFFSKNLTLFKDQYGALPEVKKIGEHFSKCNPEEIVSLVLRMVCVNQEKRKNKEV